MILLIYIGLYILSLNESKIIWQSVLFTPVLSQFSSAIHSPYVPSNSCINHKLCPVLSIQCVCGILNNRTLTIERLEQDIQIYINMHIDLSRHWKKDWHAAMLNERLKLTVEIMAFPFCHVAFIICTVNGVVLWDLLLLNILLFVQ